MTTEEALENGITVLRKYIRESPPLSYTAEMARRTIAAVQNPNSPLTTEQKFVAVTTAVRGYKALRLLDSSHHHPGDRPNGVIE